jgi:hypothetical protein
MLNALRRQHSAFFRLGNQAQSDEVCLEHFDALPGQTHLSGDHVETNGTIAFLENAKVLLFDRIEAKIVDLLDLTHALNVRRRNLVGCLGRRLAFGRFKEADCKTGSATAFPCEHSHGVIFDGPSQPLCPLPNEQKHFLFGVVGRSDMDAKSLKQAAFEETFVVAPIKQNDGNVTTCLLPRKSFLSSSAL